MTGSTNIYAAWTPSRIHGAWACLVGRAHELANPAFRGEALGFARQMMRRVREELCRIVDELAKDGYHFAENSRVLAPPDPRAPQWIEEFSGRGVAFSVALEAFLLEVGTVNLTGSHPSWPIPAHLADGTTERVEPFYTDPLVVELTHDDLSYQFGEWQQSPEGSFRLEVSPDHIHKANVSGGLPYQLDAHVPAVDSVLLNERHCTTFVGYLRHAIMWRGFPGFDYLSPDVRRWWVRDERMYI